MRCRSAHVHLCPLSGTDSVYCHPPNLCSHTFRKQVDTVHSGINTSPDYMLVYLTSTSLLFLCRSLTTRSPNRVVSSSSPSLPAVIYRGIVCQPCCVAYLRACVCVYLQTPVCHSISDSIAACRIQSVLSSVWVCGGVCVTAGLSFGLTGFAINRLDLLAASLHFLKVCCCVSVCLSILHKQLAIKTFSRFYFWMIWAGSEREKGLCDTITRVWFDTGFTQSITPTQILFPNVFYCWLDFCYKVWLEISGLLMGDWFWTLTCSESIVQSL